MTTFPTHLSALWDVVAPALGSHLWQSTLFAVVAALLTLVLRKNHARARYWLWLAASLKFLIPFWLLVSLGGHLPWARSTATKAAVYFTIEEIVRPGASSGLPHILPSLLMAAWLTGFVAVVFVWCARWRRVRADARNALLLHEGREVCMLRRLEGRSGARGQIEILLSRTSLEPGVFGILHPILLWPNGISQHLDEGQLQAILAHEVCHVRRRDNLAAAAHMLVEAVFWFHPLVWWLGARLVEERERACDEAVLEMGSERHAYAQSILKVCEFCVESPLPCVSGVTGADLKKRMVTIMNENVARKLDFGRKLLLSAAGLLVIAAPIVFGVMTATPGQAQSGAETTTANAGQPGHPVHVKKDIMQGLILTKVPPQYPESARKNHVQGTVMLDATISKDGNVAHLQRVSGDATLASAAIEAVKQWKYKPFLLNGEPVEVLTQVQVTFTLSD